MGFENDLRKRIKKSISKTKHARLLDKLHINVSQEDFAGVSGMGVNSNFAINVRLTPRFSDTVLYHFTLTVTPFRGCCGVAVFSGYNVLERKDKFSDITDAIIEVVMETVRSCRYGKILFSNPVDHYMTSMYTDRYGFDLQSTFVNPNTSNELAVLEYNL